jgi:N-acetylmuramoyl-L-alanine amidase
LDEVDEARRVTDRVAVDLRDMGVDAMVFHDNTSKTQSTNLATIIDWHNARARDRDVSIHFNAFETTNAPRGTEVCYQSTAGKEIATRVSAAIARAGTFTNRGAKLRTNLAFLSRTARPAVLIEVCFVDSNADADLYNRHFSEICRAIAESLSAP